MAFAVILDQMTLIIFLFSIGIFLLAAEVLVPGGILGVFGGILLFTACVFSFVIFGSVGGLIAVLISLLVAGIVFYIQFRILPKTGIGRRFFLNKEISSTARALDESAKDLIGMTALSSTVLSPSGYVMIEQKRFEAVSQSGQIEANTELIVTAANSFQLTVRTKP